uniref:Alanine--glyoxylate aminotransferase n=1 Tax=Acrobeloides nanus TaxID=290746 RepID=A0A914EEY8_9BILA
MSFNNLLSTIPPATRILEPLKVPSKLLMGPGPSNMRESIMDDVKAGLQYLFQTNNELTFAVSGSGHAGMECAVMNLLEPGETVLVVQTGIWGQRVADLVDRLGGRVQTLNVEAGKAATLEMFSKAMEDCKPAVVFVCQGESSTGVAQPLEDFGDVCHKNGTLLLVDAVASIGCVPLQMDALDIDCVYAATQKVLGAPPGLAMISFSERAVQKMRTRKTRVPSFYLDAFELANYWGCSNEPRRYHHTAPISLVYALREALSEIANEGLEQCLLRHRQCADFLYSKLEEIGLKPYVKEKSVRLPGLTTIELPPNVEFKLIIDKLMSQGIEISGGLGPTVGKVWRIGTFGVNADKEKILKTVHALDEALKTVHNKDV